MDKIEQNRWSAMLVKIFSQRRIFYFKENKCEGKEIMIAKRHTKGINI